jgi:chitin synthase
MADGKLYGEELDEEKADMSLDYVQEVGGNPYDAGYDNGYGQPDDGSQDRDGLLDGPAPTQHFGLPPEGRVTRRHKTKKRVPLTAGNLVIDLKIPTRLESFLPTKGEPEMMSTR